MQPNIFMSRESSRMLTAHASVPYWIFQFDDGGGRGLFNKNDNTKFLDSGASLLSR